MAVEKSGLRHFFRGFHSSLAPTARPGSYAEKPLLRKAFCGFDAHPPRGPSLVPSGQFTLCRQIRSKPPEGKAERRQWREERGGSPVSKGAPGRPHGPTQRDLCELHCGPRTPRGLFDSQRGSQRASSFFGFGKSTDSAEAGAGCFPRCAVIVPPMPGLRCRPGNICAGNGIGPRSP